MHRIPYRGDVRLNHLWRTPLRERLARPWSVHAAPRSSLLFAPLPRSTWVSLRTARQVVKPNCGGAAGPACPQGLPVRCGCARYRQVRPAAVVRARTHTNTYAQRCLWSVHTQLAQLPYPPDPPPTRPPFQHSFGQLKIVNRPTPQSSALFQSDWQLPRQQRCGSTSMSKAVA